MSMTLRDLVARGTPLDWFESVAIVQELAAAVQRNPGPDGPRVPDLPGAELTPDGTVNVIDPGAGDQAPVFRLAHVLNALLSTSSPPVQLRLIVLSSLSPEPTYNTVFEVSQALEYFERPDRREIIRRVYERAARLPAPAVEAEVAPLPDRPQPAPREQKPVQKKKTAPWPRERVLLAVALPLALAIGVGGWWGATRPSSTRLLSGTKQLVSGALRTTVDTIRHPFAATAAPVSAVEAAPAPEEPKPAPPRRPRVPRLLRTARSLARNNLPAPVTLAPSVVPGTWVTAQNDVDEVVWLDLGAAPTVYSPEDADVRPPVAVRPRLPSQPPPGVTLDDLTKLEVLVSPAGEVESVRIVTGPRTALDGMMVSAVKAWQFQPATKDGRPVAYRHQVWLTNR